MSFIRSTWLLPLLAASVLRASSAAPLAVADGEMLTYHVSWMLLPGVGAVTVKAVATTDPTGAPLLRVISTTGTRGLAYLILPFEARSESLFDGATGRLIWLGESSQTRKKHMSHTVSFDYAKGTANYTNSANPDEIRPLPLPHGSHPTDLITCLLEARNWNLQPGQSHDATVLFDDEFFELTVHAIGYETIFTPRGQVTALVLEPRMEKTPPKGMFKRGSTVKVWIALNQPHLPVRFQVQFSFGLGTATLTDYRPPAGPAK